MNLSPLLRLAACLLAVGATSFGCDLCGCYLPSPERERPGPFALFASVAEQFTHFGTLQYNDGEVPNPTDQHLDSSITQFVVGAAFFDGRLGLQVNVPYLYRSFQRPEGFGTDRGHESGLGDVSLLANWRVFRYEGLRPNTPGDSGKDGKTAIVTPGEPAFAATLNLFGGVKFPTGDAHRITEEFSEVEVEGAPESGIHGHDLALGTGSYDGVLGLQLYLRYQALFFQAETQYTLRGDGHYSYHFADDLTWRGGPGIYLWRQERNLIGLSCVLSGENKATDRFQGRVAEDTGVTALYVGPAITAQFGNFTGDVGGDLPVIMNTTKLQAVPDYRIRASVSWHF